MSKELTENFVLLITYLLPGFLAAWVFYGLTSHPKPSHFERVVQALIFTFIIQILIPPSRWLLEQIGSIIAIRPWDSASEGAASLFLAIFFGALLAYLTNTDKVHKYLRGCGFTTRTSHPSEWYYVLSKKIMFVILHLHNGKRLYGWPKEWPVEPDKGQFYITLPSWIKSDGKQIELPQLDGVLVNAKDVKWVEFVRTYEELK